MICDFVEEGWPSMDLVGDMLCRHLVDHCSDDVAVTQVRPSLQGRFTRLPLAPKHLAWNVDRLINRFADYPLMLRRSVEGYDLFHVVDHSYAQLLHELPPSRTVVTCHDLDTFRGLLDPEREPRPRWYRAMSRRVLRGFQQAAHVIAVSESTRDELLRYDLFPRERISVVPNGVHPSCSPSPDPPADAAAAKLLPESGDGALWLLNVGSTVPRKRLDLLLEVFAAVRREVPGVRLLRVGGGFTPQQTRLAKELDVESAVTNLPFLDRATLAAIYRRADVLLHTAEAEGFGLPVIEAMACGCPVVASDIPVLREVGGPAAVFCRVADVEAWKDTVVRLLCEKMQRLQDAELRRQRAVAYALRFSWAENARKTARVYQSVLGLG